MWAEPDFVLDGALEEQVSAVYVQLSEMAGLMSTIYSKHELQRPVQDRATRLMVMLYDVQQLLEQSFLHTERTMDPYNG